MKKKLNYDQPLELTTEQLASVKDPVAYFRVVLFENGVLSDGTFDETKMSAAITLLMIEKPELKKVFKTAVRLYKKIGKDPLAQVALRCILYELNEESICQCPACQMKRAMGDNAKHN